MSSLTVSGALFAGSSVQRSPVSLATTDAVLVKPASEAPQRDAATVLALVREKYAPLVAQLPVPDPAPQVNEMLRELRGLRRLSDRATRRMLGRD